MMTRWKCGVSRMALLVCAGSLAAPLPALATDITTTVTTAQTLNPGDTLNVTNTGAVAAPTNPAVSIIGGATASFLTNSGTIQSTGSGAARTIRFVTSTTANVTITNNAGAFIQGPGDVIQSNININSGTISIINAGTIRSTGVGGSNGQAIDLDNIQAGTATVNITNLATGVISAADSDAIRPANNATVNNYGQIISNNASAANGNASGNDGIDFNTNTNAGTVNNYSTGLISAARHGITAAQGVTVFNAGTIIGNDAPASTSTARPTPASLTSPTPAPSSVRRRRRMATASTSIACSIWKTTARSKASASPAPVISPKASPSAAAHQQLRWCAHLRRAARHHRRRQ